MSKYEYEEGEIDIQVPLCTTCKRLDNNTCGIYKKDIPKDIRFEYGKCKYYVKTT